MEPILSRARALRGQQVSYLIAVELGWVGVMSQRYASCLGRIVAAAALAVGLCACSYVKIVHSDGTEETRVTPIAVNAPKVPSDIPRSVRSTSVGIAAADNRLDLGVHNEDVVYLTPQCHAVFIVRTNEEAETAAKLAKGVNAECVTVQ
jgi:hypothetical protein